MVRLKFELTDNAIYRKHYLNEPSRGKTNNLHMQKQIRRSASRLPRS